MWAAAIPAGAAIMVDFVSLAAAAVLVTSALYSRLPIFCLPTGVIRFCSASAPEMSAGNDCDLMCSISSTLVVSARS